MEIGLLKVTDIQNSAFNDYFADIGPNLVNTILVVSTTTDEYMKDRPWPEMEDIKRSGVRAHVFLIIQCTIQISGSVLANTKWLFISTSIVQ